jgi:cysteine desulfurase
MAGAAWKRRRVTIRTYADHAATTPVRDEVLAAMLPHFTSGGFNASSLHAEGRAARAALDAARRSVAQSLGARPRDIVFTGGGSESDNLALIGAARASAGPRRIVTSAIEHAAIRSAAEMLRGEGFESVVLGVDAQGRVDPRDFAAAVEAGAAVASIMLANNEIGTLQPIAELTALARARGVTFHTDAVQAPGRVPIDVASLGVDLLTISAHKFYGPKGVGALYVRPGTALSPVVVGGGQEAGLRAGTENVAGIVGLARALELAVLERPLEAERLRRLRDTFEAGAIARISGCEAHGARAERLPNVSSLAFPGVDAAALLVRLDLEGFAVSTGSACAAGSTEPSHVIAALGKAPWAARGTVRFSFGKLTSEQDVERLAKMLPGAVEAVRDGEFELGTEHCGLARGRTEGRF